MRTPPTDDRAGRDAAVDVRSRGQLDTSNTLARYQCPKYTSSAISRGSVRCWCPFRRQRSNSILIPGACASWSRPARWLDRRSADAGWSTTPQSPLVCRRGTVPGGRCRNAQHGDCCGPPTIVRWPGSRHGNDRAPSNDREVGRSRIGRGRAVTVLRFDASALIPPRSLGCSTMVEPFEAERVSTAYSVDLIVSDEAEIYVRAADAMALISEYALVESDRPNVNIRVPPSDLWLFDGADAPWPVAVVDLLDAQDDRSARAARGLADRMRKR